MTVGEGPHITWRVHIRYGSPKQALVYKVVLKYSTSLDFKTQLYDHRTLKMMQEYNMFQA